MNRDRVLVPMSRSEADRFAGAYWHGDLVAVEDGLAPVVESIRAALDRDREETIARIADEVYKSGWTEMGGFPEKVWGKLGKHEREPYRASARAVLALLEGADDE